MWHPPPGMGVGPKSVKHISKAPGVCGGWPSIKLPPPLPVLARQALNSPPPPPPLALLGEEIFAFFAPKLPPNKQKCAHLCLGWHTTPPQHLNCKLPRPMFVASMLNCKHPPPLFVLPVLNIKHPPPRFVLRGGCYKVTFVL